MSSQDYKGKRLVLNIFPSIDTEVCAASVRIFYEAVASLDNTTILCISRDLPFVQARFCGAEGMDNIIPLSDFNNREFGKDYGVEFINGRLAGLLFKAVVIINKNETVIYTEQVPETLDEPDYSAALEVLSEQ